MRTAQHGLIVAYGLLVVCWVWDWFSPRLYPADPTLLDFILIPLVVIAPCATVAFATFCGSVVCAGRALRSEASSRTAGGYITLALSFLSACGLFALGVHAGFIHL